jgi:hypothetical protein
MLLGELGLEAPQTVGPERIVHGRRLGFGGPECRRWGKGAGVYTAVQPVDILQRRAFQARGALTLARGLRILAGSFSTSASDCFWSG